MSDSTAKASREIPTLGQYVRRDPQKAKETTRLYDTHTTHEPDADEGTYQPDRGTLSQGSTNKTLRIAPGGIHPPPVDHHQHSSNNKQLRIAPGLPPPQDDTNYPETPLQSPPTPPNATVRPGAYYVPGIRGGVADDSTTQDVAPPQPPEEPVLEADLVPPTQEAKVVRNTLTGKKLLLISLVAMLVIAGIVAGVVVSLLKRDNNNATPAPVQVGWSQVGEDVSDGEGNAGLFGHSVALSANGTIMAVGAPGTSYGQSSFVGVYQEVDDTWVQLGGVLSSDDTSYTSEDLFGWSVSLSADGTTLAVGAPKSSNSSAYEEQGQVYVFHLVDGDWATLGNAILGEDGYLEMGTSVVLSADGRTIAIGVRYNNYVVVYRLMNQEWKQLGSRMYTDLGGDEFGYSVSLSADGSVVAAGAPYNQYGVDWGVAVVFQFVNGDWEIVGDELYGRGGYDFFGSSVSLSGDGKSVAVGASGGDYVAVYQWANQQWAQVGSYIFGENFGDLVGPSVSLSANGTVLAVGDLVNESNGLSSGQVNVFQLVDGDWKLIGDALNGRAVKDRFGISVALSADGKIVAVGADQSEATDFSPGYTAVYRLGDEQ